MIFFTSDTHFGHDAIIGYCNRPYANVSEMDDALVENWNSVVGPEDTVFHLGDVSFHTHEPFERYLSRLNGKKHLVIGNHDHHYVTNPRYWESTPTHYREIQFDMHGELTNKRSGHTIVLCHYPIRQWNKGQWGSWMLHGHAHGTIPSIPRSIDVGTDCHNYRPVSLAEVALHIHNTEGDAK